LSEFGTTSLKKRASGAPMRPGARRQRAHRERAKNGQAILRLPVNYFPIVEALIASSRLTEGEALDRRRVEAALAEVLVEWAGKWTEIA
jgi:hypothetical protein